MRIMVLIHVEVYIENEGILIVIKMIKFQIRNQSIKTVLDYYIIRYNNLIHTPSVNYLVGGESLIIHMIPEALMN